MKNLAALLIGCSISTAFASAPVLTIGPSARQVQGTKTIAIGGSEARQMYETLTGVLEAKVNGAPDAWVKNSQNIQCTKTSRAKRALSFACHFDLSSGGTVLNPSFD